MDTTPEPPVSHGRALIGLVVGTLVLGAIGVLLVHRADAKINPCLSG